jgi:dihydrofolate reductase
VSRNATYAAPGATVVGSLDAALAAAGEVPEAFLIGGAELYRQGMALADSLVLTEIDQAFEGDAFFPPVDPQVWQEVRRDAQVAASGLPFAFVRYQRRAG